MRRTDLSLNIQGRIALAIVALVGLLWPQLAKAQPMAQSWTPAGQAEIYGTVHSIRAGWLAVNVPKSSGTDVFVRRRLSDGAYLGTYTTPALSYEKWPVQLAFTTKVLVKGHSDDITIRRGMRVEFHVDINAGQVPSPIVVGHLTVHSPSNEYKVGVAVDGELEANPAGNLLSQTYRVSGKVKRVRRSTITIDCGENQHLSKEIDIRLNPSETSVDLIGPEYLSLAKSFRVVHVGKDGSQYAHQGSRVMVSGTKMHRVNSRQYPIKFVTARFVQATKVTVVLD